MGKINNNQVNGSGNVKERHRQIDHLEAENKPLVRYQHELEEALAGIREELAMDFHDNLGSQLARLAMFAGTLQNGLDRPSADTAAALLEIQQMSRGLSAGIRDFIWSVDPRNDNLREIFFYLKDFGDELFEHTGVRFSAVTDDVAVLNRTLFHSHSRHLVPIFKEALTNCFRHSECQTVTLAFAVQEDEFVIRLQDDGKGIRPAAKNQKSGNGKGIKNMYRRASQIHGRLQVESAGLNGTVIILTGTIPQ